MRPKLLWATLALGWAGLAPAAAEELRIGFVHWPPYVTASADGRIEGFDVDVARSVCAFMGRECAFSVHELADLFDLVETGELDLGMGGLGYTSAREVRFDMSCVYVPSVGVQSYFYGLDGVSLPQQPVIAVDAESIQEDAVVAAEMPHTSYAGNLAGLEALVRGEVDLFLGSPEIIDHYAARLPPLTNYGGLAPRTDGTVIVMGEGRAMLRLEINGALATMESAGQFDQLKVLHPAFAAAPEPTCGTMMLSSWAVTVDLDPA